MLVTDRHATGGRDLVEMVTRALDAGLPAVQLREKDLPGRPLLALAERLRRATADHGALLFVNDRLDVALAVGADGVHLGERSFPADVARSMLPPDMRIGCSTHTPADAAACGADFCFFGPVFATPSKAAFGAPHGCARLGEAARGSRVPVFGIGGIGVENVGSVLAAGAYGAAVIRAILTAPDPAHATRTLLAAVAQRI